MTDDPRINPTATLLKKIPRTQLARLISKMEISAGADVTGAMKGKLLEIAKIKCPVQVFNGLKKGNFLRALKGEIVGTKIF
jgi:isopentenyl phosphate kinase